MFSTVAFPKQAFYKSLLRYNLQTHDRTAHYERMYMLKDGMRPRKRAREV